MFDAAIVWGSFGPCRRGSAETLDEVNAGREAGPFASHHEAAEGLIGYQLLPQSRQFVPHERILGVVLLWPSKAQGSDVSEALVTDRFERFTCWRPPGLVAFGPCFGICHGSRFIPISSKTQPEREQRGYKQYCGAARALDVVGDRWTLLIVRELTLGPRRFTDLIDGLPGISRNLLAQRLRDLKRDGVVSERELPPPAARHVYELTEDGHDLAVAARPLVAWGARRLSERKEGEHFRPYWALLAMAAFADREAAKGVTETYQYVVGNSTFHFSVADGMIELLDGPAKDPVVMISTDEETWGKIAAGEVTASAAAASGSLTIIGTSRAVGRLRRILSRRGVLVRMESTLKGDAI